MSRNSDQALLIFTRNPEPGKCKTRLAADIGDAAALEIYKFLVRHTARIAAAVGHCDRFVYYSDYAGDGSFWDPDTFHSRVQQGPDLGARMEAAFRDAFDAGYQRAILIGSDLFDLEARDLETAFDQLGECPVVIGPATDGGYYLIGMREPMPALFRNKLWGTSKVLADTLTSLQGINYRLLDERNDIDYYEDIAGNPVFEPFLNSGKP